MTGALKGTTHTWSLRVEAMEMRIAALEELMVSLCHEVEEMKI